MEEQISPIQLPFDHLSTAPPFPENKYASADEDIGMPMSIQTTIAEDERRPRTAAKRKQRSTTQGNTRATMGSKKAPKTVRQNQAAAPYQYADELKRFEEYAKRINQILVDRANKEAIADSRSDAIAYPQPTPKVSTQPTPTQPTQWQVVQPPDRNQPIKNMPIKNQWQAPTPIEEQTVEGLKLQPGSIHQRLHELGLYLNEADSRVPVSDNFRGSNPGNSAQLQHPSLQNAEAYQISSFYSPTQPTPLQIPQTDPFSHHSRGTAANRFPRDRSHSRSVFLPITLHRSLRELRGRVRDGMSLELPRKPIDRLSDAALWIATFAIVRVASRYVLTVFPMLAPIFLGAMLAPAIAAVCLIVCVPKAGWIAYYRLFLIMVGFLVGGKL
jgi:hypothetical protein